MIDLVDSGVPIPTAESIAARAGVSLRTVFRHFEEMENLYLEIAAIVFDRLKPYLDAPIQTRIWPDVLHEVIRRRAEFFEAVAPFKVAIDVYRHRSEAVAEQHRRITAMSRELLVALLPANVLADREMVEILSLVLSIESWQRLRTQQDLSVAEASAVLLRACETVVVQKA